jgi:hypothetical protein
MLIHNYQIHNVLNVYRRQLARGTTIGSSKEAGPGSSMGDSALRSRGKRKSIIDKVTTNIADKISMFGSSAKSAKQLPDAPGNQTDRLSKTDDKSFKEFVFNIIDQQNRKVTNSISVQDSKQWISRLEALARQAALHSGDNPAVTPQWVGNDRLGTAESQRITVENQAALEKNERKGG